MQMDKPEIVKMWCSQRVGCPYIMGGTGRPCTPSYREARMAQYPAYAEKIKRNCPRLSGKATTCADCKWYDPEAGEGKLAYDCAQLSRWAMDAIGISLVSGANSQWEKTKWAQKGKIADLPNDLFDKISLVFRYDEDKKGMGHVGIYQGDGTVIHAKGHDWGVVRQPLNETSFTHYAMPYGLYEEVSPLDHPTLRRGDSGEAVTYLQTLLCDVGECLSVDGKFGEKTEKAVKDFQRLYQLTVDGVVGPATWDALEKATGHQDEPGEEAPEEPQDDHFADASKMIQISREDWNAIRAAAAVLIQTVKKYESVG